MEIDKLANILGANTVEKAYDDAASQPMKEVGKTATDIVKTLRLFTAPFQLAAAFQDRLEKYLNKVRDNVPKEKQIECHPIIAGPVIDRLKYLDDENKLTALFLNLLERAINVDRVNEAHPAFIHIIDQLSPDEAYILFILRDSEIEIVDTLDLDKENNKFINLKVIQGGFPEDKLIAPDNFEIYYSHLESLNLIQWPVTKQDPIWNEDGSIQLGIKRYSKIEATSWGKIFIKACIPEKGFDL
ncbi:MAG: Abi-alpha family protein [Bacillota bacterium]|nr:Abi-alpha family protein [Bacillota bacterium]